MAARRGELERRGGLVLAFVLVLAVAAAVFGRARPAALPADAPAQLFSAGRAGRIVAEIARAPHPVGSEEHDRVEGLVLERLAAFGDAERAPTTFVENDLVNLLLRIPGRDSTGTLLLLAHYDSVPTGPGAGDDSTGVATWLEVLRALEARGWAPRNDVLVLLSDGEELGLLGAQAFSSQHPLADDVRCVVNLEAIGNGGPAVLFQLGPENGPRVRAFADVVPHPTGTSLADAIYRRMRNDTDLTVFLWRGIGGFNLALTSGSSAYHAPHDTPANLDPRSLQHMGECALALAEHLGDVDLTRLDGPDLTFFDVLGRFLVVLPRWVDWVVLGLGVLATALALRTVRVGVLPRATSELLFDATALAAMLGAGWWLLDRGLGLGGPALDWTPGNTTVATLAFLGLVAIAFGRTIRRARDQVDVERGRAAAAIVVGAALACLAAWRLPGASFALSWPLVLVASSLALRRQALPALVLHAVTLPLTLVLALPILELLLQLFWRTPEPAIALTAAVLALLAAALAPHTWWMARSGPRTGGALLGTGLALLAVALVVSRLLVWRQGAFLP